MTIFHTKSYILSVAPIEDDSSLVQGWLEGQLVCQFVVEGEVVTLSERDGGGITAHVQQGDFSFYISQDEICKRPTDYIATVGLGETP